MLYDWFSVVFIVHFRGGLFWSVVFFLFLVLALLSYVILSLQSFLKVVMFHMSCGFVLVTS